MPIESCGADFGVGKFPDGLDEMGVGRGKGIDGDADRIKKVGWEVLEGVYVVGERSFWWGWGRAMFRVTPGDDGGERRGCLCVGIGH